MATTLQIQTICDLLIDSNTTAPSFVLTLLTQREYDANPCTQDLLHNSRSLLSAFLEHPQSSNDVWKWASSVVKQKNGHWPEHTGSSREGHQMAFWSNACFGEKIIGFPDRKHGK